MFFFFSSRRRHTRFKCDWSSDVCSSDLNQSSSINRRLVLLNLFADDRCLSLTSNIIRLMKRILKWIFRVVLVLLVLAFLFVFVAYWRSTNDCDKKNAAAPTNPMKAIVHCDYGLANLKLEDIEKPVPADDQILVKVHAVSVNPYDWHFVEGTPKIMRMMGVGLRKPKETRLGVDFAGTIEAVGKNVSQFKPGDDVFGGREGA